MNEIWYKTFKLWSKTTEYQKRINESKNVINKGLKHYRNPYIAYSGGKDSIVMLHLVLQENKNIDVWHWDHGKVFIPREIENAIIENAISIGTKNIIVKSSEKLDSEEARYNYKIWYRTFFGILSKTKKERKWDLVFLGIRQEEGIGRKIRANNFFNDDECYPLARLNWKDVWAYIVSNNIPYPSIYDKYADIIGYDKVRLVTFFDIEFEKFGSPYIDGVLVPEFRNICDHCEEKK